MNHLAILPLCCTKAIFRERKDERNVQRAANIVLVYKKLQTTKCHSPLVGVANYKEKKKKLLLLQT